MKSAVLVILFLCFSFIGAVQAADISVILDPTATWVGYMNVFETPANGGGYLWGSAWGTADLRAAFATGSSYLNLRANTNCWNAADLYWVSAGTGNKSMEATFMREFGAGHNGKTVTFTYEVVANNLAAGGAGYITKGFIKTLNPATGYSVVDLADADLTVGTHTLNMTVSDNAALILQVGFTVRGLLVDPASPEASLGVTVRIPGGTPALRPVPSVGSGVAITTTSISWTNPDPNSPGDTVTAAAYLLASDTPLVKDPNLGPTVFDPGVVALTVDPGQQSATVALALNKYYYWAVHIIDSGAGTIPGFHWNFQTFDAPPSVTAPADQYLVATASPMTLTLDSTVSDDKPGYTIAWTDITAGTDKDPATTVTINTPALADTTVTLANTTGSVSGYYRFTLTVTDTASQQTVRTPVIVGVYATCKEAAIGNPADGWNVIGDLDGNCKVNLADFAMFAATWLDCNAARISCP